MVGLGVARLDLERLAQRCLGGFALAKVVERRAKEVLRVGILRI